MRWGLAMSDLEVVREFDATPEEVWRALTEPAELGAWFWPSGHHGPGVPTRPGRGPAYGRGAA